MAFPKFANAKVVTPNIDLNRWESIRVHSSGNAGPDFTRRSSKVVMTEYDPNSVMLSHCTIMASVDTESSQAPLGKHMVDGFQIDRRYADWLIIPETAKYVNNNGDAWERKLLISAFRTFIGGENYVEHIQIPELSKGKIIDAAVRDIGDSVYVDILIATDRKHKPLIRAITSGKLQTLSMGCSVAFTQCTKCGNVAFDETELCTHVKYFKGNTWVDEQGKKRVIAELCGHINEEPGSVKFIEASWVANPAFTGAVLRSILTPSEQELAGIGRKMQIAFSQGPRVGDPTKIQKAAFLLTSQEENPSEMGDLSQGGDKSEDPVSKAVDELVGLLREKAIQKIRSEIGQDDVTRNENRLNESLIKSALRHDSWKRIAHTVMRMVGGDIKETRRMLLGLILYKKGGWRSIQASGLFSGPSILALSRMIDLAVRRKTIAGEGRIYRTVLAVGGPKTYLDERNYIEACKSSMGRDITDDEKRALLTKGKLFDLGA